MTALHSLSPQTSPRTRFSATPASVLQLHVSLVALLSSTLHLPSHPATQPSDGRPQLPVTVFTDNTNHHQHFFCHSFNHSYSWNLWNSLKGLCVAFFITSSHFSMHVLHKECVAWYNTLTKLGDLHILVKTVTRHVLWQSLMLNHEGKGIFFTQGILLLWSKLEHGADN